MALEGEKREKVVIIGEAVDAAGITSLLRKKVGHASIQDRIRSQIRAAGSIVN